MSRAGDQDDQPTAAHPSSGGWADPSPGVQAWDSATPSPTETYPATAPSYPDPDSYSRQSPSFTPPQHYGPAGHYVQPAAYQGPGVGHPYPAAPYPYPVREAPMCGLAVASLVCGIVWVYWITSILAIIFAAVALGKIKREGLRGRGLAIAGLVLGIVWMAFLVLGVVGVLVGGATEIVPFVYS